MSCTPGSKSANYDCLVDTSIDVRYSTVCSGIFLLLLFLLLVIFGRIAGKDAIKNNVEKSLLFVGFVIRLYYRISTLSFLVAWKNSLRISFKILRDKFLRDK